MVLFSMIRSVDAKRNRTSTAYWFRFRLNPNVLFWLCFLGLNLLLFLPMYVLNMDATSLLPQPGASQAGVASILTDLFLFRENADIFRLNLEFCLLVALWLWVARLRRRPFRMILTGLYLLILVYYIYESVSISIYLDEPAFYSHYFFFKDGGRFLLESLHLSLTVHVLVFAAIVGLGVLISSLIGVMLDIPKADRLSFSSRIAVLAIAVATLLSAFTYRTTLANTQMVVSSFMYKIQRNVEESVRLYRDIAQFDGDAVQTAYDYSAVTLGNHPNIYLIFVESYGSVLYKRPDFRSAYVELASRLDGQLTQEGWHTATTLSESTTWGGGSWMAYTSALFGLRIDSHPEYLSLLNTYRLAANPYPSLGRFLKSQGYQFAWLSSIAKELDADVWDDYADFYGIDRWLGHADLNYSGRQYGWGPAPPDQFVLNFAHEEIVADSKQPVFMFFITQNSHYPWVVPELADNWRELDEPSSEELPAQPVDSISHQTLRQSYLNAIDYELSLLTDFVMKHGDEDAIFVFVGDHQPPRVSRRNDGLSTPIHIVSKDRELIAALEAKGFRPGLTVQSLDPTMRHEGFYSLFVRTLAEQYGLSATAVPDYLPDGVAATKHGSSDSEYSSPR